MSQRYFCIHGHFYQPPREDAITGLIPNESGVAPYNNWNEKIHAECYKPNAELGNFEKISFNILVRHCSGGWKHLIPRPTRQLSNRKTVIIIIMELVMP